MSDETPVEPVEAPLLRIVKGDPKPEEVAALVAVVSALASAPSSDAPRPRSEWAARHRLLRGPHRHGPGAWRASAR
ncbi:MAG: acyl-CoA carboxylase subunit epsilon [Marmoricola sp.]|nr:acyl-CoA carboxylase subunit epsilon [Marmoricola sp.]